MNSFCLESGGLDCRLPGLGEAANPFSSQNQTMKNVSEHQCEKLSIDNHDDLSDLHIRSKLIS
eukprot:UN16527